MNTKSKLFKIATIIACGMGMVGCSYINSAVDKNPPTQRQQQCGALKNQLTLKQGAGFGTTTASSNVAQDARAVKLYDKYNCSDFERQAEK